MVKAIALLSGGLDSILAVELIRKQNIHVIGVTFSTPFFRPQRAKTVASQINLPLEILDITKDFLEILKAPRYGYGKNMNPCIDCHTLMLKVAGRRMVETQSHFIITGEVLGQRPMSQNKQSLYNIAKNSGYADYILRPLSAKLLEPTKAEREHLVNRSRLLSIQGRGRKSQLQLAAEWSIKNFPPPAGGCLLTDPIFSRRLRDLLSHQKDPQIRDYELLKYGRHFRINEHVKIIVGRNQADNEAIKELTLPGDRTFISAHTAGPFVLIPYGLPEASKEAAALCVLYSDVSKDHPACVLCRHHDVEEAMFSCAASKEDCKRWMI